MDGINLETSLDRPLCVLCKTARIRPIGINGTQLMFDCPHCRWRPRAELPPIHKTIIYLDTSTVSHLASAKRAGKSESKWLLLYDALRESAANDVICCVDSSILQREAELSRYAAEIVTMSRAFGDPHPRHDVDVTHAQLFRALDRFLSGAPPAKETSFHWNDAFRNDPHRWQGHFRVDLDNRYPQAMVDSMRSTKVSLQREVTKIYDQYATDGLDFEAIRSHEANGFGRGVIADGCRAIKYRLSTPASLPDESTVGLLLPTTFDHVVEVLKQKLGLEYGEAIGKAIEFLKSDHAATIPIADIGARLHAALAMAARGPKPRLPSRGDAGDIAHLATFLPYVGIFIVDRFFASLCSRPDIRLGDRYGTKIRSLGERDVDEFVAELRQLHAQCAHAKLSRRIQQSIEDGGYIQERTQALKRWLDQGGEDIET